MNMKNKKIKWICLVLGIVLVLCVAIKGCYYEKKLDNPNLTSYIFNANIEQVRIAIVNNDEEYEEKHLYLWSEVEDKEITSHTDFKKEVLLARFDDIESKIYFRFGKPLLYTVEFNIHLDSISENKTRVEIFTLEPKIFIFGFGAGHIGINREKEVPPSTIEEYEILLSIGEQLGEKGMPPCNYPK